MCKIVLLFYYLFSVCGLYLDVLCSLEITAVVVFQTYFILNVSDHRRVFHLISSEMSFSPEKLTSVHTQLLLCEMEL